jgi:hypothetical protein
MFLVVVVVLLMLFILVFSAILDLIDFEADIIFFPLSLCVLFLFIYFFFVCVLCVLYYCPRGYFSSATTKHNRYKHTRAQTYYWGLKLSLLQINMLYSQNDGYESKTFLYIYLWFEYKPKEE